MANAATKFLVAGLLAVMPGTSACFNGRGGPEDSPPDILVQVKGTQAITFGVLPLAETKATRMFAEIGVRVQWLSQTARVIPVMAVAGCASKSPEAVIVEVVETGGMGDSRLAFARPYARDGVRVTIFYKDVSNAGRHLPRAEAAILAHVLVHEITHVVEGVARHSKTGVMRPYWTDRDFAEMMFKPIRFAELDVLLLQNAIANIQTSHESCEKRQRTVNQ
jgi:hypothetical protein